MEIEQDAPSAQNSRPEVPYVASFIDSIIHPALNPPGRATKAINGMRVLHPAATDVPKSSTIRFQDIASLPSIEHSELPLSLDDPRRIYASGVPGVKITHPGGPLEGGPPAQPYNEMGPDGTPREQPEFVKQFLEKYQINTPAQLLKAVKAEQTAQVEELRKRMRAREEANENNRRVQEKVDNLVAEREMERRVHESAMEQQRRGKTGGD